MKQKLTILAAIGVLMQLGLSQPPLDASLKSNLERLYWLCSDQQLPVKGFVIETWFSLPERNYAASTLDILKQELDITEMQQQKILEDGSQYNANVTQQKQKYYLELQLISRQLETAKQYEQLWRYFSVKHKIQQPLGTTLIVEFPELLNDQTIMEIAAELVCSLDAAVIDQCNFENGYQIVAFSPQLQDSLQINNKSVNLNLFFCQREDRTILYLGAPIIYQQY